MEFPEPAVVASNLNRRDRAQIAILTVTCCALAGACWWQYAGEVQAAEAAAARTIFAVSEGKVRQISNWRRERIGDGKVLMSASTESRAGHVLSDPGGAAQDAAMLHEILRRLSSAFLYSDAALVDMNGDLRLTLSAPGGDQAQFARERRAQMAREANAANDVVLSDLTNQTRSGRPLMALTIPVRNRLSRAGRVVNKPARYYWCGMREIRSSISAQSDMPWAKSPLTEGRGTCVWLHRVSSKSGRARRDWTIAWFR
jgi:hypothetical protein